MGSLGFGELIILAVPLIVIFSAFAGSFGRRGVGATLVLTKFTINESGTGPILEVTGRRAGLIGWLMTVVGLEPVTKLVVTDHDVSVRRAGIGGVLRYVVPLDRVASTHCGFIKPVASLILGVLVALGGVLAFFSRNKEIGVGALVIGVVLIIIYFVSTRLSLSVESKGGMIVGLGFKSGVIQGATVGLEDVTKAVDLINRHVLDA